MDSKSLEIMGDEFADTLAKVHATNMCRDHLVSYSGLGDAAAAITVQNHYSFIVSMKSVLGCPTPNLGMTAMKYA
ncbi:hypothetical protein TNCV_5095561 [Trichonephila clavipes]|nr:hypothetical protein TNCV_5095561 [Trichonephila clavipes]